ncbi:hypothetical protein [Albirhodobacter sp. R86504]|uniref:hypothetical protein n=1 Tax=Albirhodobacter sp. R86504 TaxID=3093848 RepID=UPI00366EF544
MQVSLSGASSIMALQSQTSAASTEETTSTDKADRKDAPPPPPPPPPPSNASGTDAESMFNALFESLTEAEDGTSLTS